MKPKKKEIKIKCLQGQMKEGEKEIDCSSYPRGMKHEVLSHYQTGYMRGMSIGVDKAVEEYEAWEAIILKALRELIAFDAKGDRYKEQTRKGLTRLYDLVKGDVK